MGSLKARWPLILGCVLALVLTPALALAQYGKPVQGELLSPAVPALLYLFSVAVGFFKSIIDNPTRKLIWAAVLIALPVLVWIERDSTMVVFALALYFIGATNGALLYRGREQSTPRRVGAVVYGLVNALLLYIIFSGAPQLQSTYADYALLAMLIFGIGTIVIFTAILDIKAPESWLSTSQSVHFSTQPLGLYLGAAAAILCAVAMLPILGHTLGADIKIYGSWTLFILGTGVGFAADSLDEPIKKKLSKASGKTLLWLVAPLVLLGLLWFRDGWTVASQMVGVYYIGGLCGIVLRAAQARGLAMLGLMAIIVVIDTYLVHKANKIPNTAIYISKGLPAAKLTALHGNVGQGFGDFLNTLYTHLHHLRAYLMHLGPTACLTAGLNLAYFVAFRGLGIGDPEPDKISIATPTPKAA